MRSYLILLTLLTMAACRKAPVALTEGTFDPSSYDEFAAEDDAAADPATDVSPADDTTLTYWQGQKPNVLFIGNSYTYTNDLPGMTAQFAKAGGVTMQQTSVTQGSATLAVVIAQTAALATIAQGGWTHVVLQGQSVEPATDLPGFLASAKTLADAVHKAGGAVAFYQTWPRKAGDAVYQEVWSGGSPQSLAKLLHDGYEQAAQQNGGVRVPVGDAWMLTLTQRPAIALYQGDGSHPLGAGTYLAACVFSVTLFGIDPDAVHWAPDGIADADASALRAMCRQATTVNP